MTPANFSIVWGVGPKLFFIFSLVPSPLSEATLEEFLDLAEEESSQIVQLERTSTELGVDGINYRCQRGGDLTGYDRHQFEMAVGGPGRDPYWMVISWP